MINIKNEKEVSVDQIVLKQKIRKAMAQLRKDYDLAIKDYGHTHNLKLTSNDSLLAKQMANTIALYDYYHLIQIEFSKLQAMENNLWNGMNEKTLSTLYSSMADAQQRLLTEKAIDELGSFKDDISLIEVLRLMNDHIKEALENRLNAILIIKKDQEIGNREQIMTKTKNYNDAVQWSNQNRQLIYQKWNSIYPIFLKNHINSI
ncbi:MAG: hypothetical protein ABF274_09360 [Nonlabens sp.]|uniref:hypothetical protein n=2 Tax=Nonlabens sp. TaxID=1888209 RepID=UPI00321A5135